MSPTSQATERTALYRLFDAEGRLLYIGISANPERRWTRHAGQKKWWNAVAKKEVEWHNTRADAEAAETSAIANEQPRHNVTGIHGARLVSPVADNTDSSLPVYQVIANELRGQILDGRLPAHRALPSEARLIEQYRVARGTVRRALETLTGEGLVEARKGAGVFVLPSSLWPTDQEQFAAVPLHAPMRAARILARMMDRDGLVALTQALVAEIAKK